MKNWGKSLVGKITKFRNNTVAIYFLKEKWCHLEQFRNSYHGSWLENWISRKAFKINSYLQPGKETEVKICSGVTLLMKKKNNLFQELKKLLFSYYLHFLTFTTEMEKDRRSSHKTAGICSFRFSTWEAAERFRQQTKKNKANFVMFPWNKQALMQILLLCFFVLHSGNSSTLKYLWNRQK